MHPFRLRRCIRCIPINFPPWPTLPSTISGCHPAPLQTVHHARYRPLMHNVGSGPCNNRALSSLVVNTVDAPFLLEYFRDVDPLYLQRPRSSTGAATTDRHPNIKRIRSQTTTLMFIENSSLLMSLAGSIGCGQALSRLSKGMFYMTSIISYLPLTTHLFLDPGIPLC